MLLRAFAICLTALVTCIAAQAPQWRFGDLYSPYKKPQEDRLKEICKPCECNGPKGHHGHRGCRGPAGPQGPIGFTGLSSLRYGNITANALYATVGPLITIEEQETSRVLNFSSITTFGDAFTADINSITIQQNGTYQIYYGAAALYWSVVELKVNDNAPQGDSVFGVLLPPIVPSLAPYFGQIILSLNEGDVLQFFVSSNYLWSVGYIIPPPITIIQLENLGQVA